jgi:hypothetical protein
LSKVGTGTGRNSYGSTTLTGSTQFYIIHKVPQLYNMCMQKDTHVRYDHREENSSVCVGVAVPVRPQADLFEEKKYYLSVLTNKL